jgi:hypothetical protein
MKIYLFPLLISSALASPVSIGKASSIVLPLALLSSPPMASSFHIEKATSYLPSPFYKDGPSSKLKAMENEIDDLSTGEFGTIPLSKAGGEKKIFLSHYNEPISLPIEDTNVRKGLENKEFLYLGKSDKVLEIIDEMGGIAGLHTPGSGFAVSHYLLKRVEKQFPEWKVIISQIPSLVHRLRLVCPQPPIFIAMIIIGESLC